MSIFMLRKSHSGFLCSIGNGLKDFGTDFGQHSPLYIWAFKKIITLQAHFYWIQNRAVGPVGVKIIKYQTQYCRAKDFGADFLQHCPLYIWAFKVIYDYSPSAPLSSVDTKPIWLGRIGERDHKIYAQALSKWMYAQTLFLDVDLFFFFFGKHVNILDFRSRETWTAKGKIVP